MKMSTDSCTYTAFIYPHHRRVLVDTEHRQGYYLWNGKLLLAGYTVVARSKAWICGRSLSVIAGSNPTSSMDVWVLCAVRQRSLRLADHQRSPTECGVSRVWWWSFGNEDAMAHRGLLGHRVKEKPRQCTCLCQVGRWIKHTLYIENILKYRKMYDLGWRSTIKG